MANLGRRRAGAINSYSQKYVQSEWKTQTPLSLSTDAEQRHLIEWPTLTILVKADYEILFDFSSSDADEISAGSLDAPGNALYEIDVPWGEAADRTMDEIYFCVKRNTANTTTVKIVEG